MKRAKVVFSIAFTVILLLTLSSQISSAIPAIDTEKKEPLPDFLEAYLEHLSTIVNSSTLEKFRHQMIESEIRKQERLASIKEPVLEPTSGAKGSRDMYETCIDSVELVWEYHGGEVDDAWRLEGWADGAVAHLHTDEVDAEAFIVGLMSDYSAGDVWVKCAEGAHSEDGWYNYVIVWTAWDIEDPLEEWEFVGWEQVFGGLQWKYINEAQYTY
jgi:hypothetical protein